ncbi:hypothetical protein [Geothrix sp. 21YS21S-4]|uniref:hypothetical protein n=1 Tax=Geothrix sp. 21YS21S-4 TaxID=3068889 RepID=UPI0027B9C158|nr:hypothetical protein [Geothrix sp. 21YS21S-4]
MIRVRGSVEALKALLAPGDEPRAERRPASPADRKEAPRAAAGPAAAGEVRNAE